MSTQNGAKTFLFVVIHTHEDKGDGRQSTYLIRCDRDPDVDELKTFLGLDFEPESGEELIALRYSEDEIPTLPPRG